MRTVRWVQALALPVVAGIAFEFYARTMAAGSDTLAPLSLAAVALWHSALDGSLWKATGFTLATAAMGLAAGGGAGVLLGVLLGLSQRAADAAFMSVELLRPVPSVALIPLAMLVFGFGYSLEVSVVAFACFWPLLLLAQAAVRQVEPKLLEVAQVLGFGTLERVWKFVLPAMLPRLFVALRLGTAIALVVAVTVELAANPHGLGYGLLLAQQSLRPELMIGWLAWIAVLGYVVNLGAEALQGWVSRKMGAVR